MPTTTLVLGAPGTGKTETLMGIIEAAMESGIPPTQIGFVSFTRAAVHEARQRAITKFGLTDDDLPWMRTIHSLAFRALGVMRKDILGHANYLELEELTGESGLTHGPDSLENPVFGAATGAQLLGLEQSARLRMVSLRHVWHDHGGNVDWFRLVRFAQAYTAYRQDRGVLDFTDLLEQYVESASNVPVRLAIVDEAQDLSRLQWRAADLAFGGRDGPDLYVAADPNQAVHRWAGADVEWLKRFTRPGVVQKLLQVSHRLPEVILAYARTVAARTGEADIYGAAVHGRTGGIVEWISSPAEADLSSGTWLMLARGAYQLDACEEAAREQGVYYERAGRPSVHADTLRAVRGYESLRAGRSVDGKTAMLVLKAAGMEQELEEDRDYAAEDLAGDASGLPLDLIWHDALTALSLDEREYLLVGLRRGEKFMGRPRVRLSTIHSAKGQEAENVVLITDMPPRAYKGLELDPEAEARVFYVGLTRGSEKLLLVAPRTPYPYDL